MRWFLSYIFSFIVLSSFSQNVYNKVRKNMCEENVVNELYTVDSCFNKSHIRDSALIYKSLISLKLGRFQWARRSARVVEKLYPGFIEMHYLNGLLYF